MLAKLFEKLTGRKKAVENKAFNGKVELVKHVASQPDSLTEDQIEELARTVEIALFELGMTQGELDSDVRHFKRREAWKQQIEVATEAKLQIRQLDVQVMQLDAEREGFLNRYNAKIQNLVAQSEPLKQAISVESEAIRGLKQNCKNANIHSAIEAIQSQTLALAQWLDQCRSWYADIRAGLSHNERLAGQDNCPNDVESVITSQHERLRDLEAQEADKQKQLRDLRDRLDELEGLLLTSDL